MSESTVSSENFIPDKDGQVDSALLPTMSAVQQVQGVNAFYRANPELHDRYTDPVLVGEIAYSGAALHLMLYLTRKKWMGR